MSKSFYKEALLDIVTEALKQPDKPVIIEHTGLNELKKVIEQALREEKVLELYRKLMTVKDELISVAYFDNAYYFIRKPEANLEKQIKELEKQIKELEKGKEVKNE